MKSNLMVTCLSLLIVLCIPASSLLGLEKKMSEEIIVLIKPERQIVEYQGPIPVNMNIKNSAKHSIRFLFNYSMAAATGIEFSVKDTKKASNKPQPFYPSIEISPTTIDPGSTYSVTFYLNKYIDFEKPGEYNVDYKVDIDYYSAKDKGLATSFKRNTKTHGSIKVKLEEVDEGTLEKRLKLISEGIDSKDRQTQLETTQALCYLETPLVVGFLGDIIKKSDRSYCRTLAIKSLGRFKTPESQKLILLALSDGDSVAVEAALNELRKEEVFLENDRVKILLEAKNSNTRFVTIEYLSKIGNSSHIPMLKPLQKDENPLVAKAAQECIKQLKDKE